MPDPNQQQSFTFGSQTTDDQADQHSSSLSQPSHHSQSRHQHHHHHQNHPQSPITLLHDTVTPSASVAVLERNWDISEDASTEDPPEPDVAERGGLPTSFAGSSAGAVRRWWRSKMAAEARQRQEGVGGGYDSRNASNASDRGRNDRDVDDEEEKEGKRKLDVGGDSLGGLTGIASSLTGNSDGCESADKTNRQEDEPEEADAEEDDDENNANVGNPDDGHQENAENDEDDNNSNEEEREEEENNEEEEEEDEDDEEELKRDWESGDENDNQSNGSNASEERLANNLDRLASFLNANASANEQKPQGVAAQISSLEAYEVLKYYEILD